MSKEESTSQKDVEKQDLEKQDVLKEFESVNSLTDIKKIHVPNVNGAGVLVYAIFVSMFAVGWLSLNNCSINMMIPIYLIVAGFMGVVTKALINTTNKHVFSAVLVLLLFDISWQVLGSYFVYREYQPNYDHLKGPYCNRMAYLLAFWIITIQYTLLGLFLGLSFCYMLMRGDFRM